MSNPTRPLAITPIIQAALDNGQVYQAILQDGTILWIPKTDENGDCTRVKAWAQESNITL